ncbi:GNAT family N-acetyltransferase [Ectothiorhodospiraceae bacterium BW-2]|nr:GNAT family N-acetyltransferase [Ectothiorhodospiraceae bacterium BW-2]
MELRLHSSIDEIPQQSWNALIRGSNPFIQHQFLAALEHNHCVGEHFGWLPCHLALYRDRQLVAALPLYEKHNSYGELVFDHAWANAFGQRGLSYYPKLVSAIPYTPVTGPRVISSLPLAEVQPLFEQLLHQLLQQGDYSSAHLLFQQDEEHELWQRQHFFARSDIQFHWENANYTHFEHFLGELTHKKRKNIHQERKKVANSDISFRIVHGHESCEADWHHFSRFYQQTFEEKWSLATLNFGFFTEIAATLGSQVVLIFAERNHTPIAGALLFRDNERLYGRHWGAIEHHSALHFETCYYRGIEYAIEQQLQFFEPGAQGEHKLARGFMPVLTRSSHYINNEQFLYPIERWANHERTAVASYCAELMERSPFALHGQPSGSLHGDGMIAALDPITVTDID